MTGMTVRARLVLGFSLVIALLVASMATGIGQLHALGTSIDGFSQERLPKLSLSGRVVETLLQSARQMRNALLIDSEADVANELAAVTRNSVDVRDLLGQIDQLVNDGTEHEDSPQAQDDARDCCQHLDQRADDSTDAPRREFAQVEPDGDRDRAAEKDSPRSRVQRSEDEVERPELVRDGVPGVAPDKRDSELAEGGPACT